MQDVAHFFIEDDLLKITLPFNSKFIKKFRKNVYNTFVWNKENKYYQTKISTYALRTATQTCSEFFELSYCDKLKPFINLVESIKDRSFEPTLVRSNNSYYISGINESIYERVKDIELDNSIKCLHLCSLLSVKVHPDIFSNIVIDTEDDLSLKTLAANRTVVLTPAIRTALPSFFNHIKLDVIVSGSLIPAKISHDIITELSGYTKVSQSVKSVYKAPDLANTKPYMYLATKYEPMNQLVMAAEKYLVLETFDDWTEQ